MVSGIMQRFKGKVAFDEPPLVAGSYANVGGIGNQWYVNETTGDDDYPGNSLAQPFATLDAALAAATANNGDVIWLSGTCHLTASLAWNKAGVHLVGMQGPSNNCRSRISPSTAITQAQATAMVTMVTVSVSGCSFSGIEFFHGYDVLTPPAGSTCLNDTGGRNYYNHCQFRGGGDALMAALAGMRSLKLTGVGEGQFEDCVIGCDTKQRVTNANASLELLSGTARNVFKRCIFEAWNGLGGNVHVKIAAAGMDRYALFEQCVFNNFGTAMDAAITNAGGSPAGYVLLNNSMFINATAIATTGDVYVNQISAAGATTTGIGIKAT